MECLHSTLDNGWTLTCGDLEYLHSTGGLMMAAEISGHKNWPLAAKQ
jgi:hypothetical protein